MLNGVQPIKQQNGLSSNGEAADFEEIIQLSNHSGKSTLGSDDQQSDPILALEGEEPFLRKTSPMKPQHVAGNHAHSFTLKNKHMIDRKSVV